MKKVFLTITALISFLLLNGCSGIKSTDSLPPVTNFDSARYLGVWYEIARLPNFFEKDLSNITATYSLREDGGINVLNKGLNVNSGKWEEAKGRAYFVNDPHTGLLKVTFFWPFYGEYRIIQLDPEYQWAVVTSGTMDYFWILSRTPKMSSAQIEKLVRQAAINGFMTSKFIYVKNEPAGGSPAVK